MTKIASWDLFDTLLARWNPDPKAIFREVGGSMMFSDFTKLRLESEAAAWRLHGLTTNLQDIYKVFAEKAKINQVKANSLMEAELHTELMRTLPIQENILKVKPHDIIVSDMYLPIDFIKELLEINGLSSDRPIYISYGGKHSGAIWDKIKDDKKLPFMHTGDNATADVLIPQRYGIETLQYHETPMPGEVLISGLPHFADLLMLARAMRLINPFVPSENPAGFDIWNEQAHINIPVLALAAIYVANKFKNEKFLFCTREALNLQKIFEVLYPKRLSEIFYSSRKTFIDNTPAYQRYAFEAIRGDPAIIDLHGAGRTANHFFSEMEIYPPICFVVGYSGHYKNTFCIVDKGQYNLNKGGSEIEDMNQDVLGSVSGVTNRGSILRAPLLYDPKIIFHQKAAIDKCVNLLQMGFPVKPITSTSLTEISQLIGALLQSMVMHKCAIHDYGIPHFNDWANDWRTFELQPKLNKILFEKKKVK